MEKFIINGGFPLQGEVEISGAKNAALPIIAASVFAGNIYYASPTGTADAECSISAPGTIQAAVDKATAGTACPRILSNCWPTTRMYRKI